MGSLLSITQPRARLVLENENRQSDHELLHVVQGLKPSSRFGSSLAIADGGQLMVGCPRHKSGLATEVGAVFVYNDVKARTASRVIKAPAVRVKG